MNQKFRAREGAGSADASFALSLALTDWIGNFGGDLVRHCGNCKHMATEGAAVCSLYRLTPPIAVIMKGCPSHEDAHETPF